MKQVDWNIHKKDFFPVSRAELFDYWVKPGLLEKWAAPDSMTLKVPQMEAREGGHYRFEHTDANGDLYTCIGKFTTYQPQVKLEQVESVYAPDGKVLFENLECSVEFVDVNGGCEIILNYRGFKDERSTKMCEVGWDQSLEKLNQILSTKIKGKGEGHVFPDEGKYTNFY